MINQSGYFVLAYGSDSKASTQQQDGGMTMAKYSGAARIADSDSFRGVAP